MSLVKAILKSKKINIKSKKINKELYQAKYNYCCKHDEYIYGQKRSNII